MANVTKRFDGPTKLTIGIPGYEKEIVFKIKAGGFLDIRNGAIVGYRGVKPQPFQLRQVVGISSAEYAYPDSKTDDGSSIGRIVNDAK